MALSNPHYASARRQADDADTAATTVTSSLDRAEIGTPAYFIEEISQLAEFCGVTEVGISFGVLSRFAAHEEPASKTSAAQCSRLFSQ